MPRSSPWRFTKMQEGAQFLPDPASWEMAPQEALEGIDEKDADMLLGEEIARRYGPRFNSAMNAMSQEMGLGDEPIFVEYARNPRVEGSENPVMGAAYQSQGRIVLDSDQGPLTQRATLAHELAHMADFDRDPTQPSVREQGSWTPGHHRDFVDFEPEMFLSMAAQRGLEAGLPVNKATIGQYPWLEDVHPLSSNMLASPWRGAKRKP